MQSHGHIFIGLYGGHRLPIHLRGRAISGIEVKLHGMLIGLVVHANAAGGKRTILNGVKEFLHQSHLSLILVDTC
eukprot:Skav223514  [mRNA]  locus=scaffold1160:236250:236673:+ [translate_table: standard]